MYRRILLLMLLIPLVSPSHAMTLDANPSVLIIFNDDIEKNALLENVNLTGIDVTYVTTELAENSQLINFDAVILASSDEFNFEDSFDSSLSLFLDTNPGLFITPFIDRLGSSVMSKIGVTAIDDTYGNSSWELEFNKNYADYLDGDRIFYTGPLTHITVDTQTDVILSAINGDIDDEVDYPIPVMINHSNIIASPISITGREEIENEGLGLDQLPFPNLIHTIVESFVTDIVRVIQLTNTIPDTIIQNPPANQTSTENNILGFSPPDFSNVQSNLLYILALLALALFIKPILSFIRRLWEWIITLGIGIVGAYFNVADRNLSHGQVTINPNRSLILDYLDYMTVYGAHLREIKTLSKLGSGSLLWHLQVLEDFGLIVKFSINRNSVFVSNEYALDFNTNLKKIELQLQSEHSQTILLNLEGVRTTHIDDIMGNNMNRRTALRILKKLQKFDVIKVERGEITVIDNDKLSELIESTNLRLRFDESMIN